jgi:AraC-like DNA-binding protein
MTKRLRPAGRITTAAMRPLLDALRSSGRDPAGLVRGAGADPQAFEAREAHWVPARLTDRIWESATGQSRPDLPLRVAAAIEPSTYGLLTYLLACCDNVGSALAALTKYYPMLSETTTYRLEAGGEGTLVALDLHGPRPSSVELFAVAVSLSFLRGQARGPLEVREVRLTQPRPEGAVVEEHERAFGAPVRFGRAGAGYVLGPGSLATPLRGAEPGLRALLEENAERALRAPSTRPLAERVRDQIAVRGAHCSVRAADIAADLALSERTLRRGLQAEGTSFQGELDAALAEIASERLGVDSVEAVAASLGFADAATFRRAFRRWRGGAPRACHPRPRARAV